MTKTATLERLGGRAYEEAKRILVSEVRADGGKTLTSILKPNSFCRTHSPTTAPEPLESQPGARFDEKNVN